jgi:predicted metal-dependent hydrolase
MRTATKHTIRLRGRRLDFRVVRSTTAKKLRVRVGLDGVEVVQPKLRTGPEVFAFLEQHRKWVFDQMARIERLRIVRRPQRRSRSEILFRGEPTRLRLEHTPTQSRGNTVRFIDGEIVVRRGSGSQTPTARSLENWLRRQARAEIESQLAVVTARLRQRAQRVYVMGQRTKWGNCSASRNISFNWRLILAPEHVLRYLVVHEAVHLAVPDHSAKFWLTVQSLCPETERAKQWLSANGRRIQGILADA